MVEAAALSDAMHFTSIALDDVRAFAGRQVLDLSDDSGNPSRWCLILGENGVGKTTILQALALMKPVPVLSARGSQKAAPDMAQAELSARENVELERLVREGATRTAIDVDLVDESGVKCTITAEIRLVDGDIKEVKFPRARYKLNSSGPLVIGYGAARHVGHGNKKDVADRDPTSSLFSDSVDLYDAEELLEELDHAARSGPAKLRARDRARLKTIYAAVASLLDDIRPQDIKFRGPKVAGRSPDQCGVHVKTPSGTVPLGELSLGYQSMFAWTVDLAFRLLEAYPSSKKPMHESAVVLIDEIDLHLHPRWQRTIRSRLLKHFPKVQFIATTHSPVTAQETLSEGGRVAVVQWDGTGASIDSDPLPGREWRIDQLMTSALFGFGMPRSLSAEERMKRRAELSQIKKPSAANKRELAELDAFAASLPFSDPEVGEILAEYRKLRGAAE